MERYRYTARREHERGTPIVPPGAWRLPAPQSAAQRVTSVAIGAAVFGAGAGLMVLAFAGIASEGDIGGPAFPLLLGGWLAGLCVVAGWGGWLAAHRKPPTRAYWTGGLLYLAAMIAALATVHYGHIGPFP